MRVSPGSPSQMIAALLRVRAVQMAVEAVVRDVGRAAAEPLRERRVPLEHALGRREPVQRARLLRPEALRVVDAAAVQRQIVFLRLDVRGRSERRRRREHAILLRHAFDRRLSHGHVLGEIGHTTARNPPQSPDAAAGRARRARSRSAIHDRVQVNDETVRALRDKYREIKRLRDEDAAGADRRSARRHGRARASLPRCIARAR